MLVHCLMGASLLPPRLIFGLITAEQGIRVPAMPLLTEPFGPSHGEAEVLAHPLAF